MSAQVLRDRLQALDGQGYKSYQSIRGKYTFPTFALHIDAVQSDPFATPSRLRIVMSQRAAQFPLSLYDQTSRRIALEDYLIRQFDAQTQITQRERGSGKSGLIAIARPSQAILPRTAARVSSAEIEMRFTVGLPAFGRRIAGRQAAALLCNTLPRMVCQAVHYSTLDAAAVEQHCLCAETADYLRQQLSDRQLMAFVADGAVLPRQSGIDERPLAGAVPLISPPSLRVELSLPDGEKVTGLGIAQGITLIVGGGYHGKSTLLKAIAAGVYNHIPGDGRERVVTLPRALKVRAEDGRSVAGVNISPFINHLPQGRLTEEFCTQDASGSTSQAASIIEAIAVGTTALLMDEDTSATNFMIRDRRMQALIAKAREPITPFIDKVKQLQTDYGVSTLLVIGGSGDYFDVADTVIALDNYQPQDVTPQAKAIAATHQTARRAEGGQTFGVSTPRVVLPGSIDPRKGKRSSHVKARATQEIVIGNHSIDIAALEQLIEPGQANAIAAALVYVQQHYLDGRQTLLAALQAVMADIQTQGLDCLSDRPTGAFAGFRLLELAAALNRLRTLQVKKLDQS
ncbi:MAG: ABC-ATPase domain-containing protein [Leptolyngbyaceae cyanobacterium]